MSMHYSMGVITNFHAKSNIDISKEELINFLNERISLDLYELVIKKNEVKGEIKNDVFKENVEDFVIKLSEISNTNIKCNFETYGKDIKKYPLDHSQININNQINIKSDYAILFIEVKVLAEGLFIEPCIINWLFRHCDMDNKLSGCIISNICV